MTSTSSHRDTKSILMEEIDTATTMMTLSQTTPLHPISPPPTPSSSPSSSASTLYSSSSSYPSLRPQPLVHLPPTSFPSTYPTPPPSSTLPTPRSSFSSKSISPSTSPSSLPLQYNPSSVQSPRSTLDKGLGNALPLHTLHPNTIQSDQHSFSATSTVTPRPTPTSTTPTPSNALKPKSKGKAHQCSEPGCGRIFYRASNLKTHTLTHTDTRDHLCTVDPVRCQRKFARIYDLRRHERCHTQDLPYKCGICEKTFVRNDPLWRHYKKEHPRDPRVPISRRQGSGGTRNGVWETNSGLSGPRGSGRDAALAAMAAHALTAAEATAGQQAKRVDMTMRSSTAPATTASASAKEAAMPKLGAVATTSGLGAAPSDASTPMASTPRPVLVPLATRSPSSLLPSSGERSKAVAVSAMGGSALSHVKREISPGSTHSLRTSTTSVTTAAASAGLPTLPGIKTIFALADQSQAREQYLENPYSPHPLHLPLHPHPYHSSSMPLPQQHPINSHHQPTRVHSLSPILQPLSPTFTQQHHEYPHYGSLGSHSNHSSRHGSLVEAKLRQEQEDDDEEEEGEMEMEKGVVVFCKSPSPSSHLSNSDRPRRGSSQLSFGSSLSSASSSGSPSTSPTMMMDMD